MLACLMRMHVGPQSNQAVVFWNSTRDFQIMLRMDPIEPNTVSFELCIVPEDEDEEDDLVPSISTLLETEFDGYYDEGAFVVKSYAVELDELVRKPDLLEDARVHLNALHAYTVCGCGAYFIKDGARMCLLCQLVAAPGQDTEHFCAICQDNGVGHHMAKLPCCGKMMHRGCLARWKASGEERPCPLCKQPLLV